MRNLGALSYFIGLELTATTKCFVIHQRKYIHDIMKKFNMLNCMSTSSLMKTNSKLSKNENAKAVDKNPY